MRMFTARHRFNSFQVGSKIAGRLQRGVEKATIPNEVHFVFAILNQVHRHHYIFRPVEI